MIDVLKMHSSLPSGLTLRLLNLFYAYFGSPDRKEKGEFALKTNSPEGHFPLDEISILHETTKDRHGNETGQTQTRVLCTLSYRDGDISEEAILSDSEFIRKKFCALSDIEEPSDRHILKKHLQLGALSGQSKTAPDMIGLLIINGKTYWVLFNHTEEDFEGLLNIHGDDIINLNHLILKFMESVTEILTPEV